MEDRLGQHHDIAAPLLQDTDAREHGALSSTAVTVEKQMLTDQTPRATGERQRKRKWEDFVQDPLWTFEIQPAKVDATPPRPLKLRPLRLVARTSLPLSCLDLDGARHGSSAFLDSRLFVSHIAALQRSLGDSIAGSRVLLAEEMLQGRLYAIEWLRSGIYTLCRLAKGANEWDWNDLDRSVKEEVPMRSMDMCLESDTKVEWWRHAVLDEGLKAERPKNMFRLSMAPPAELKDLPSPTTIEVPPKQATEYPLSKPALPEPEQPSLLELPQSEGISNQLKSPRPTRQQVFDTLVTQYLDALYLSRTSLAFFAKGPLSRTRAAFSKSSSNDNSMHISELTTFIRTMLLTMPNMDRKFRETVPSLIRDLPLLSSDDEDGDPSPTKKKSSKKSSKKKKLKLGKNGTYQFENDYVKRWWKGDDESSPERIRRDETAEQSLRRRVGDLRIRETLAQIILTLEVLALEASPDFKDQASSPKDTAIITTTAAAAAAAAAAEKETAVLSNETKRPTRKAKKPQDLNLLLDLLVDKLTIWQSVENEPGFLVIGPADDGHKDRTSSLDRDRLGSFCIEVIIPFYKSRVPEQAAQIVKKFDNSGSSASPEKSKKPGSSKQTDANGNSKDPSANNKKSRRNLQKTNSEIRLKRRGPGLYRSVTDTAALVVNTVGGLVKREPSENPSISSIPLFNDASASQKHRRRDSLASLKHLKARQINISEISASAELRRKRKTLIEEELRDAIDGVKKPNRGAVGKEVAEEREKRVVSGGSGPDQGRKGTKGARSGADSRKALQSVQNVQVLATPHRGRTVDVFAQPLPRLLLSPLESDCVPSSGTKAPDGQPLTSASEATQEAAGHAVAETPSRGPARRITLEGAERAAESSSGGVPDSIIASRTTFMPMGIVDMTPSRGPIRNIQASGSFFKREPQRNHNSNPSGATRSLTGIQEVDSAPTTPSKQTTVPTMSSAAAKKRSLGKADQRKEMSIYEALGWNDDDDVDELA